MVARSGCKDEELPIGLRFFVSGDLLVVINRSMRRPLPASQAGMSLLEIIIVIVLIGAVLAFVGSRIIGGADRAKVSLTRSQIQTLAGKIESYQLDTGKMPGHLEDLVNQPNGVSNWLGPYAKDIELKDQWGHPFIFHVPGQGKPFDLISYGKDGKPGGSSFDADIIYE